MNTFTKRKRFIICHYYVAKWSRLFTGKTETKVAPKNLQCKWQCFEECVLLNYTITKECPHRVCNTNVCMLVGIWWLECFSLDVSIWGCGCLDGVCGYECGRFGYGSLHMVCLHLLMW